MASVAVSPTPEKLFVGRNTAAELLDVSTRTIDEAIKAGDLEAFRIGRRVLVRRAALIQFAERVRSRHRTQNQDTALVAANA